MSKKTLLALLISLGLSAGVFAMDPIDINKANAETLAAAINGVGIKKAEAIVAHRRANGPFAAVEDLVDVQGIGEAIVERNRATLKVDK